MTKLKEFQQLGFKITWKLISIGLEESGCFSNQISVKEIKNYSETLLEQGYENKLILLLAGIDLNNVFDCNDLVKKLSIQEKSDYSLEYRKWIVLYTQKNIKELKKDPVQGLLDLGDIWAYLDFPKNSPHIFQGKDNLITPKEYYTKENYYRLYYKHIDWIKNEVKDIVNLES